jgi:hypothetical protein
MPRQPLKPLLAWADPGYGLCNQATSFDVELATDTNFTKNLMPLYGVNPAGHQLHLQNSLLNSTRYYWHVKGRRQGKVGLWSLTYHFTTMDQIKGQQDSISDGPVVRVRYFVEDCCAMGGGYKKLVSATGNYKDALQTVTDKATQADCTVYPIEVDMNFDPGTCDTPAP